MIILYKDSANERNESLLSNCRVQPILYKDSAMRRRMQIYSQPLTIFSYSIHNLSRSAERGRQFSAPLK
ncbi:MAG TPA: hypothetical protein DCG20_03915 [Prevotella sp.]|nr:hypothetical protein [Prevotella sp.]